MEMFAALHESAPGPKGTFAREMNRNRRRHKPSQSKLAISTFTGVTRALRRNQRADIACQRVLNAKEIDSNLCVARSSDLPG